MPVVNTLKRHLADAKKQGDTARVASLEVRIAQLGEAAAPAQVEKPVVAKTVAKKTAKKAAKKKG